MLEDSRCSPSSHVQQNKTTQNNTELTEHTEHTEHTEQQQTIHKTQNMSQTQIQFYFVLVVFEFIQ